MKTNKQTKRELSAKQSIHAIACSGALYTAAQVYVIQYESKYMAIFYKSLWYLISEKVDKIKQGNNSIVSKELDY